MSNLGVPEEDYEKASREKTQKSIEAVVPRELLPNGSYAPIPGIYDIGWKKWTELPQADFTKEMRKLDDGLVRENKDWVLRLATMIARGEFTLEQVKEWELAGFSAVDTFAVRIAQHVFNNLENREVRDIILRHAAEETGHAELKVDFLVRAFGLDRARDVWGAEPSKAMKARKREVNREFEALKEANPILAYATVPFLERTLPMQNQLCGKGLREHYGFKDNVLGFYDLHTYVDIYHERLGLYLIGKYATKSKDQALFRQCVESMRMQTVASSKAGFDAL